MIEKKPLITHMYSADPSANVFNGKLYIYPSHDLDIETIDNDNGDQYAMVDYHVYEMEDMNEYPKDLGCILHLKDVPWASKQMWAPDAAEKDGKFYFYFPARDKDDIFRIGVAVADSPAGPFKAQPEPIKGSLSIDPCIFPDEDGKYYLSFGGLWGGQLDKWKTGTFDPEGGEPADDQPAVCPKIALMSDDMLEFAEKPRDIVIVDENGVPLKAGDRTRRYFEGPWMHKYNGTYYLSYSTGDTHLLVYATADNPYGPFTYRGVILTPVLGWTTHHSIVEYKGEWYLFYHDCEMSKGVNHKRNVKFAKLEYRPDGSIVTISPN
ncbi:MAG TPA: glycoside hydrolase family 43 protein [Holophaga sp.]|nr:glycoside hydrolase family 43 protein [Holophaga sp.]